MREAPSRVLIAELLARGARVQAYDPVAMTEARRVLPPSPSLAFAASAMDTLAGCRRAGHRHRVEGVPQPGLRRASRPTLRQPVIFDGRNMFSPPVVQAAGIEYHTIGRLGA